MIDNAACTVLENKFYTSMRELTTCVRAGRRHGEKNDYLIDVITR